MFGSDFNELFVLLSVSHMFFPVFMSHIFLYLDIDNQTVETEVNNIYTQGRAHSFCQASNMKNWVNLIYDLVQGFRIFILIRQGTWVPGGFVSVLLLCLQPSWDPACLHLRGMSLGSLASLPAKISHCFVPSEDLMYLKISVQFFLCYLQTSRNLLCSHLRKNPFQLPCPSLSHTLSLLLLCVQPGELKVLGRAVLSQYFCTSSPKLGAWCLVSVKPECSKVSFNIPTLAPIFFMTTLWRLWSIGRWVYSVF